jgi:hypothetical protein
MFARRWAAVFALISLAAVPAAAQTVDAQCAALPVQLRDACQKGTDIFNLVAPQLNGAIAGGNAVLGTANTLGGFGKISIGVRATAVDGRVPNLSGITLAQTGAVQTTFATERAPVPAPAVDVALGVFKGLPVGVNRLFSLDAIANVAYVPTRTVEDFSVSTTDGSLKLGYGGRVGITRDGFGIPAISVSYLRRELPTTNLSFTTTGVTVGGIARVDSVGLTGLSLRTESIRVALSKKLGFLEIGGGAGQDDYTTAAGIRAAVSTLPAGLVVAQEVRFAQTQRRRLYFGSFAINFPVLKLAVEGGQIQGGDPIATYNRFTDLASDASRLFASAGVRISF